MWSVRKLTVLFVLAVALFIYEEAFAAEGGELDGKAVECSFWDGYGEPFWVGGHWGISFENGKAFVLFVNKDYPPRIQKTSFSPYILDEDTIIWRIRWHEYADLNYFLNRKTLELSSITQDDMELGFTVNPVKGGANGTVSTCEIKSVEEIESRLSVIVENLKTISDEKSEGNKL